MFLLFMEEKLIWEGKPSHWKNIGTYILCTIGCWLILPLFYGLWKWYEVESVKYSLTNQRLFLQSGVLLRITQEIELYRIKDYKIEEPLQYRFFNLANLVLTTSDKNIPILQIEAIPDAPELRNDIRSYVEILREQKHVREIDM
ncbi:MAG: PH domain-containing protein [Chitinophagales bacterium]|nr:PH domain-containing protein [Bacteroidota bacterium]MCB9042512.1 PH domain-containing protein [Chitinophagales bacterium]